jgi:hypothetical protein
MIIEFDTTATNLQIKTEQDTTFLYSLEQNIDLTDFIKNVSESNTILILNPEKSVLLEKEIGSDINKLIIYIVKIIDAFNEAFTEVNK